MLLLENQAAYVQFKNSIYYVDNNKKVCHSLIVDDAVRLIRIKPQQSLINPLSEDELFRMQKCVRHFLLSEHTENVFAEFRKKIEPNEMIKTGFHFDDQLFLKACEKYVVKYRDFSQGKLNSSLKNNLFCCQVIGFILNCIPICYAMFFCGEFYNNVMENKPLIRSQKLENGADFFSSSPFCGLGFDSMCFNGRMLPVVHDRSMKKVIEAFLKFSSDRNEIIASYDTPQPQGHGCCVTM